MPLYPRLVGYSDKSLDPAAVDGAAADPEDAEEEEELAAAGVEDLLAAAAASELATWRSLLRVDSFGALVDEALVDGALVLGFCGGGTW